MHKHIYTEKYAKMQFTFCALQTVQKLSMQQWRLNTGNKRHIGDMTEA